MNNALHFYHGYIITIFYMSWSTMLDGLHFSNVHLPWHCIFQTTIYKGVWSPGFVYPVSISGLLLAPPSLIAVQPIPVSLLQAVALPICVAHTCTWKTGVLHLHHIVHTWHNSWQFSSHASADWLRVLGYHAPSATTGESSSLDTLNSTRVSRMGPLFGQQLSSWSLLV